MKDGRPFAFAGLWERWTEPSGQNVESCAVITTTANDVVLPVHDRRPVIVHPADFATWLDARTPASDLLALLRPFDAEGMTAVPVGRYVSNPRNEGAQCLAS